MTDVKRSASGVPPAPPTTPRTPTVRSRLNLGDDEDPTPSTPLPPLVLPAVPLTAESKALAVLAPDLVTALAVSEISDVFRENAQGSNWKNYFDPRFVGFISKTLTDLNEYKVDIWLVAKSGDSACSHFASMVNYHYSWDKLASKNAYRQKEALPYLVSRYQEALAYFKEANL